MEVIFERAFKNKLLGPGLLLLLVSVFYILLFFFIILTHVFPLEGVILNISILLLIFSFILLLISIFMIVTTKSFIIYDVGIQYVTRQILPHRNYDNNFIPYSQIQSFIVIDHPVGTYIQIKNSNGWIYEIPVECICKKVGHEQYESIAPLEKMIEMWKGEKEIMTEKQTTMRGDVSVYQLSDRESIKILKKNITIIMKIMGISGVFVYLLFIIILYSIFFYPESLSPKGLLLLIFLPALFTEIILLSLYYSFKTDRRFKHFFK